MLDDLLPAIEFLSLLALIFGWLFISWFLTRLHFSLSLDKARFNLSISSGIIVICVGVLIITPLFYGWLLVNGPSFDGLWDMLLLLGLGLVVGGSSVHKVLGVLMPIVHKDMT